MGIAILLIEDDDRFASFLARFLEKEGHAVERAATGAEGLERFAQRAPDLVLLDLMLPDSDGLELLQQIRRSSEAVAVIVMTAHGSIDTAVQAMRLGAADYLTKPFDLQALMLKLDQARTLGNLRADLGYLLEREQRGGLERLIGSCAAMQRVYQRIRSVARTDNTTVLITGPSGTGKELVARAVHGLSERRQRPLMQIDCTALPVALLESELFGHERGAFTGADRMKKGLLELADQGTLLLDEIGDMDLALQGKLLRVLQERQFRRVGGSRQLRFDVRVIAATNQDLDRLAAEGRFRGDLLYRLKVFQIELPPLRDRGDDRLELAKAFVGEYARRFRKPVEGLEAEALAVLAAYPFPGNVRELRNVIEQAVILADGPLIGRDQLSISDGGSRPVATTRGRGKRLVLEELGERPLEMAERELIRQALRRSGGKKNEAARLLGLSRFALQRRLEKLAVELLGDDD